MGKLKEFYHDRIVEASNPDPFWMTDEEATQEIKDRERSMEEELARAYEEDLYYERMQAYHEYLDQINGR